MMQRAQEVGVPTELITAARAVNRLMPKHVAGVLRELLYQSGIPAGQGRVLFLGWSYKAGVGDARETPTKPLAENLVESGIHVATWDPYLLASDIPHEIQFIGSIDESVDFDIVVLATAHPECISINWQKLLNQMRTPILYDGRRVLDLTAMRDMGWKANAVGSPIHH